MAGTLTFEKVPGPWRCGGDWKPGTVFVTRVKSPLGFKALVYMCNINIDYDGSSTAYGPSDKVTQDVLSNAGPSATSGWYGVASLKPEDAKKLRETVGGGVRPWVDETAPVDKFGRYPVVQQVGEPNPGYYVSAGSKPRNTAYYEWDQRRWWDSNSVAFAALSGQFANLGVDLNDVGVAIRLDRNLSTGYWFKDAGHGFLTLTGNDYLDYAVGEASNKVFTDLGGVGKNNYFPIIYISFPGSRPAGPVNLPPRRPGEPDPLVYNPQLRGMGPAMGVEDVVPTIRRHMAALSSADNADDLAVLLNFYQEAGKTDSGLKLFEAYQKKTDQEKQQTGLSVNYHFALRALRAWGYNASSPPGPGPQPVP